MWGYPKRGFEPRQNIEEALKSERAKIVEPLYITVHKNSPQALVDCPYFYVYLESDKYTPKLWADLGLESEALNMRKQDYLSNAKSNLEKVN